MNIVQAWKKAKDGNTISIEGIYPYRFIKGEGCGKNLEMLFKHALGEENQVDENGQGDGHVTSHYQPGSIDF
jgi:hypothetical protein